MIESIFNKLLLCLLIFHTIFIVFQLLAQVMYPSWYDDTQQITELLFYVYYIIRPFGKWMRFSSTFFTTVMARERYLASCSPIEYRNLTLTINHRTYILKHLMLALLTSAVFIFPIYIEAYKTRFFQNINKTKHTFRLL